MLLLLRLLLLLLLTRRPDCTSLPGLVIIHIWCWRARGVGRHDRLFATAMPLLRG